MLVYEHLYQKICNHFLKIFCEKLFSIEFQNQCIKNYFLKMFAEMQTFNKNVICIHRAIISNSKISWKKIFNNRICMWCLKRKSENIFTCDHVICDTCVRIFKERLLNIKYQYQLEKCLLCLSEILKITLKSSTAEIRILSINDGESRDVVFLKFLRILQNMIENNCSIQDLFDLAFETSSDIIRFNIWLEQFTNVLRRRLDNLEFFSSSMKHCSVRAIIWLLNATAVSCGS